MRSVASFFLLITAFLLASWLGWWAIPLVAALWSVLRPVVPRPILSAALAALLGWLLWLLLDWAKDPAALGRLVRGVSSTMQLPSILLLVITLLFPALLAWSASALACGLANALKPH